MDRLTRKFNSQLCDLPSVCLGSKPTSEFMNRQQRNRRSFIGAAIAVVSSLTFLHTPARAQWPWSRKPLSWSDVNALIELRFPNTPKVSTTQLAQWLDDGKGLTLLDVRQPAEFAVSQIRSARLAPKDSALQLVANLAKDSRIIVYCSVGYRSAEITLKLRALGFTQAFNCEGSIFQWANEGRPLFRGQSTARLVPPLVHPFDTYWATLLQESLRAPV